VLLVGWLRFGDYVLSPLVRKFGGRWVCRLCGALLNVHPDHVPNVIVWAEGGERALVVDGVEIHRCSLADPVIFGGCDAP
jgi:hypothetical protein